MTVDALTCTIESAGAHISSRVPCMTEYMNNRTINKESFNCEYRECGVLCVYMYSYRGADRPRFRDASAHADSLLDLSSTRRLVPRLV